jgi:hypothetical protein
MKNVGLESNRLEIIFDGKFRETGHLEPQNVQITSLGETVSHLMSYYGGLNIRFRNHETSGITTRSILLIRHNIALSQDIATRLKCSDGDK